MRLVVIAALASLWRAPEADACTCRPPTLEVSPSGNDVPINATVMIWVPERYSKQAKPRFALRTKAGKQIAFDSKSTGSGKTAVFELRPKQPLAANTTYEVVEHSGNEVIAQTFTTGTRRATDAPKWKAQGIGKIRYVKPEMCGGGSCMNCEPNLQFIWVTEVAKPETLRVGLWIGTTIDLTKPPTTYVNGLRTVQLVGDPTYCRSALLAIPQHAKLKVAAKLFDVAGNASDASESMVDTTAPESEPMAP